jgi:MFS family permease
VRKLLLLVGAVVFTDTMFFAALTPLLPEYADALDLSKAEAGVLSSAYAAGALVGGLPAGLATARFGVKPTVLLGLAGMAATTLTFGLADVYWLLVGARFLQGLASALSWTAALSWLVAAAPPERRGELIGTAMASAIGGALLGPVVGGVASIVGTGWAFGSVAVLAVGLGASAVATPAFAPQPPQPLRRLLDALRDPAVVAGGWLVLLPALLFGVLGVLAPLRLDELGFGAVAIGATFLIAAGIEALINPAVGRFSDRRGRLLPLRAGLLASLIVTATIAWIGDQWLLAAFVVAAGMSFGTLWTPAMSLLADASEALGLDHAYGFALMNLAWAPGAAAGAAFGGGLAEATADWVPYLALAAACALTVAAISRLRVVPAVRPAR